VVRISSKVERRGFWSASEDQFCAMATGAGGIGGFDIFG
jgi:hypothetical protein